MTFKRLFVFWLLPRRTAFSRVSICRIVVRQFKIGNVTDRKKFAVAPFGFNENKTTLVNLNCVKNISEKGDVPRFRSRD